MNADDRATTPAQGSTTGAAAAPTAPQRSAFRPVAPSPTAAPQQAAPHQSAPQTGANPQVSNPPTGSTPTRASAFSSPQRQAAAPTPAAGTPAAFTPAHGTPAAGTPGVGTPQTSFQWPGAAAPAATAAPVTAPNPTVAPARPAAPVHEEHKDQPVGAFSTGVDKMKDLASRAKTSLTEGDDLAASNKRGGPRKARVLVSRVDPWSVLKIGFLLSIAAGIMLVVATFVLWNVINEFGLFVLVNQWVDKLFDGQQQVNLEEIFKLDKVMSAAVLISVVNVVLLTALTTIAAFLYNTVSSVVGGIYVTLTDD